MPRQKLRNSIAMEAARLMLRGKETDYSAACKRAARWLSRRKLEAADIPTAAEIQTQLYMLSGLFSEEHQTASRTAMRAAALELMTILKEYDPHVSGSAIDGIVTAGAAIEFDVKAGTTTGVAERLKEAGFRTRIASDNGECGREIVSFNHGFPCEIIIDGDDSCQDDRRRSRSNGERLNLESLRQLVERDTEHLPDETEPSLPASHDEHEYHADAFAAFEMLLNQLEQIQLNPETHPEGDALYHSLQTFELGVDELPYDEEFLLACLLHDVGLAIARRNPVRALLQLAGHLLTDRTCFLIENLAAGTEFLRSGRIAPSLRRSVDFDELITLARCDRDGRVRGAEVRELCDALDYITGIEATWDESVSAGG